MIVVVVVVGVAPGAADDDDAIGAVGVVLPAPDVSTTGAPVGLYPHLGQNHEGMSSLQINAIP